MHHSVMSIANRHFDLLNNKLIFVRVLSKTYRINSQAKMIKKDPIFIFHKPVHVKRLVIEDFS